MPYVTPWLSFQAAPPVVSMDNGGARPQPRQQAPPPQRRRNFVAQSEKHVEFREPVVEDPPKIPLPTTEPEPSQPQPQPPAPVPVMKNDKTDYTMLQLAGVAAGIGAAVIISEYMNE